MRQMLCVMACAAMVGLFCAEGVEARGWRGCSSGCGSGGCYSGGYVVSGCGSCGVVSRAYHCAPCMAAAPVGESSCPECAALGMKEATLVVRLPASASLKVDDYLTKSTSSQRVFQTPPLKTGESYAYTLTAEVVADGQTRTVSKKIEVRPGETTHVTLEVPTQAVAAK
jgi:uncharacterized protein (TIGR03000 family)